MGDRHTVISFLYPHEAYIAKGKLETEGIELWIKDEFTIQVYSFFSQAIGGVKLQVEAANYDKALKILGDCGYFDSERVNAGELFVRDSKDKEYNRLCCPYCDSAHVVKKKRTGYIVALSLLLFSLPLPFFKKNYLCFDCGKEWRVK